MYPTNASLVARTDRLARAKRNALPENGGIKTDQILSVLNEAGIRQKHSGDGISWSGYCIKYNVILCKSEQTIVTSFWTCSTC